MTALEADPSVADDDQAAPFACAGEYLERGWWPLPLPPSAKSNPPTGFTGTRSPHGPTRAQIHHWIATGTFDGHEVGNICVRLQPDIIGIDVDDGYSKDGTVKNGAQALAELEMTLGTLPPTYSSTARGWGESRIRFYRVPVGTRLRSDPADSIEIIQHHHRYAVVAPSVHPQAGTCYRWFDPVGEALDEPPHADDLTELPWEWIEALRSVRATDTNAVCATPAELEAFYAEASGIAKPEGLKGVRTTILNRAGSRHDRLVEAACMVAREALAGWYPMKQAEEMLRAWWVSVIDDPRRLATTEFDDAIAWGIAQAPANPDQLARKRAAAEQRREQVSAAGIAQDLKASPIGELPAPERESQVPAPTTPTSWSDAHVGEAFGESLRDRWRFCRALGGWLGWDGRRWVVDQGEAVHEEFRQWIIVLGSQLWQSSANADTMKAVARYRDKGKIDAAVTIARRLPWIAATASEFDAHPHLLNVHNGIVDLRDGTLGPHDPAMRLTRLAGAEYHPNAAHADTTKVLEALEPDVRSWVQQLIGSAAFGSIVDDVLAIFDGQGSNGKTAILKGAAHALGDYAAPASVRLLMSRGVNDEHPTLIADLFGRRLVYVEETPEGGALRMEQVKNLTGGGALKARFIARDYFEFEPTHTIVVATNHRPAVNASDHAAWRRLRLVPFRHTYRLPHEAQPGDRIADRGLRTRLGHPAQRQAMLAWIVAGAVAVHTEGGLGACEAIDQATSEWRRSEDVIHAWWDDSIEPGVAVAAGEVYRSYVTWCHDNGRHPSSNKEFAKRLTDHDLYSKNGVTKRSTSGGAFYYGIALVVVDVVAGGRGSHEEHIGKPTPSPTTATTSRTDAKCCPEANDDGSCWVCGNPSDDIPAGEKF